MVSSTDLVLLELEERFWGYIWDNFGFMVSTYFLPLFFTYLEAMDLISLMFFSSAIFATLKGLEMVSSPDMPVQ